MKWLKLVFLPALLLAGCKSTDNSARPETAQPEANQPAPPTTAASRDHATRPVLFIAGDSTVHNSSPGFKGWGDVIDRHFDSSKIGVDNRARGGRSSRTFQTQGWWNRLLATARPGDFVMLQFGHNDGGPINDTNRARGTLPGLGDETREIFNRITHTNEMVHTYGWYMRKYVADARAKGVTPIICSPVPRVPRQIIEADAPTADRYVAWSREVAERENVDFIDLNRRVLSRFAGMTPSEIKEKYFTPQDNTHFNQSGAELNAECVTEGLRALTNCPLTKYLAETPAAAAPAKDGGGH